MVEIDDIIPGSVADKVNLKPGDSIISINDEDIKDFIDFEYETAENFFYLTVKKREDNSLQRLRIERDFGQELGIVINKIIYDELKKCNNNCIFCFVDQQPEGLRGSLKLKDDDYRFSFLQGSYITLTNLDDTEFERIIKYRLSPLYISVHTTNPHLREKMMRNKNAAEIMKQLKLLADNGIKFNTQIVLCPGINDGNELDRTIKDLMTLYPAVISLGVVPVGLTKFRNNLTKLLPYNKEKAKELLEQIKGWQEYIKEKYTKNWLYAADEFYLLADEKIPEYNHYNDFPQLENGIGLTRKIRARFNNLELPGNVKDKKLALVTSSLGKKAMSPIIKKIKLIKGLELDVITISNKFYGREVTVTGLLTASDIKRSLKCYNYTNKIIISDVMLNDKGYFLDGKKVNWLKKELSDKNIVFCSDIDDVMEVIINGKTGCSDCR